MADVVTTQTIQDGQRKAVMKFTNVSDGTGESAVAKLMSPLYKRMQKVTLVQVLLFKEYTGPVVVWV